MGNVGSQSTTFLDTLGGFFFVCVSVHQDTHFHIMYKTRALCACALLVVFPSRCIYVFIRVPLIQLANGFCIILCVSRCCEGAPLLLFGLSVVWRWLPCIRRRQRAVVYGKAEQYLCVSTWYLNVEWCCCAEHMLYRSQAVSNICICTYIYTQIHLYLYLYVRV